MRFGPNDLDAEIALVQALRADPPARASGGRRRKVFSSALEQFAELLTASSRQSPSTSPITLFYGLSQAGRAIAAAHCRDRGRFELSGHGLKVVADKDASIAQATVKPDGGDKDAFSVVAEATSSQVLSGPVTLSALWRSLPQIEHVDLLACSQGAQVRQLAPYATLPGVPATSGILQVSQQDAARDVEVLLADYPRARGVSSDPDNARHRGEEVALYLTWPDADGQARPLAEIHETYLGDDVFYLRPSLHGDAEPASVLMTTWALLLVLSSLARYHPVEWSSALDLDHSSMAIPLRQALTWIQLTIPRLVCHALVGTWSA